jgi:hypothetical protein
MDKIKGNLGKLRSTGKIKSKRPVRSRFKYKKLLKKVVNQKKFLISHFVTKYPNLEMGKLMKSVSYFEIVSFFARLISYF